MANQGLGKMHLDLYTSNSALTHKAKFWCNYVGALKGKKLYTTTWVEIIFKGAFFIQQPETLAETIELGPLCITDLFQNKSVASF